MTTTTTQISTLVRHAVTHFEALHYTKPILTWYQCVSGSDGEVDNTTVHLHKRVPGEAPGFLGMQQHIGAGEGRSQNNYQVVVGLEFLCM